ncbi:IS21 family transposase [Legionella taurinensis]|uniref:IS21 family transposase n=1 Tax=Legionella taurinensis TaxID=70611 RepID=UPI000E710E58|nr:IS21 family transposase [Legionella taurinensis]RJT63806.1 IS21 family transposase [Legionella taurinensis]
MPNKRITMRNIREILRLRLVAGLSVRQIHRSARISVGAIQKLLSNATALRVTWPQVESLGDKELAVLFYPKADTNTSKRFVMPDWSLVHSELKRKGMTKQLLWEEYTEQYPNNCYSYPQYCANYIEWAKRQKRSMRQLHKAGEKLFVDYAGQTIPVIDARTGEIKRAQIFVAVMGCSSYTFAEATWTQSLPDWLSSHVRALSFFGGVPGLIIPDNLRSGVSKACRYDPDINPSYQQLAAHYGVGIIPARPYKPKDKAKAEVGVQVVERWILARLRHYSFFSLAELNACIKVLLKELNERPFKQMPGNRLSAFEQMDKPSLKSLPEYAYQFVDIKRVKVNIDYHVQYQRHHYSVPHQFVGEVLELHAEESRVCLYFQQKMIASHARKFFAGMTTEPGHMPERHQKHHSWSPGRLKNWAKDIGPDVLIWVDRQLSRRELPEQSYRVCLGLLNLSRTYPAARLNAACARANDAGLSRLKNIKNILESNLDKLPIQDAPIISLPQSHENIRGPHSFH